MDGVLNDVLNSDEPSGSDEFDNEMVDHESFIDSDVEIIGSSATIDYLSMVLLTVLNREGPAVQVGNTREITRQ